MHFNIKRQTAVSGMKLVHFSFSNTGKLQNRTKPWLQLNWLYCENRWGKLSKDGALNYTWRKKAIQWYSVLLKQAHALQSPSFVLLLSGTIFDPELYGSIPQLLSFKKNMVSKLPSDLKIQAIVYTWILKTDSGPRLMNGKVALCLRSL